MAGDVRSRLDCFLAGARFGKALEDISTVALSIDQNSRRYNDRIPSERAEHIHHDELARAALRRELVDLEQAVHAAGNACEWESRADIAYRVAELLEAGPDASPQVIFDAIQPLTSELHEVEAAAVSRLIELR